MIDLLELAFSGSFRQEQIERHEYAEQLHAKMMDKNKEMIRQNHEKQKELEKKLQKLKEEETKLEEEGLFQIKVQDTAQKVCT